MLQRVDQLAACLSVGGHVRSRKGYTGHLLPGVEYSTGPCNTARFTVLLTQPSQHE